MKYLKTFEAAVKWNFKKRKVGDKIVCIYTGNQSDRVVPLKIGQTYIITEVSSNGKMYKLEDTDERWWYWNRFTDELEYNVKKYNL
jgi:hypothetical protein